MNTRAQIESNTWTIGMGLAPIPQTIRDQMDACAKKNGFTDERDGDSNVSLPKGHMQAIAVSIRKQLKQGYRIMHIYENLLTEGLLTHKRTGNVMSISRVKSLAYDIKRQMGLSKDKTNKPKIAYEMREAGKTDEEISEAIGIMKSSVRSTIYRHKTLLLIKDEK